MLNRYPDTDGGELGPLQGKIVGALFFVWFVVFVSLVFGKQVLAKVCQFAVVAAHPYACTRRRAAVDGGRERPSEQHVLPRSCQ